MVDPGDFSNYDKSIHDFVDDHNKLFNNCKILFGRFRLAVILLFSFSLILLMTLAAVGKVLLDLRAEVRSLSTRQRETVKDLQQSVAIEVGKTAAQFRQSMPLVGAHHPSSDRVGDLSFLALNTTLIEGGREAKDAGLLFRVARTDKWEVQEFRIPDEAIPAGKEVLAAFPVHHSSGGGTVQSYDLISVSLNGPRDVRVQAALYNTDKQGLQYGFATALLLRPSR